MSANQDGHHEKSPLTGDSSSESSKTQASSEPSNTISNANATQGSNENPSTLPSTDEPRSTTSRHLDLSALAAEPAPGAVQDWLPHELPRDEATAPQEMRERIASMMAPFEGRGAAEESLDDDADIEQDPTPPSDG